MSLLRVRWMVSVEFFGFLKRERIAVITSEKDAYMAVFGFLHYFSQKVSNSSLYFLFFLEKVVKNPK